MGYSFLCWENAGSPPQVRGKLGRALGMAGFGRITPAGAGKTLTIAALALIGEDHPRRCGENTAHPRCCRCRAGSPPQVRGKRAAAADPGILSGITPAGAGKTRRCAERNVRQGDHPRRCGENGDFCFCRKLYVGSPPQVRGKPDSETAKTEMSGITPAGAGKTVRNTDGRAKKRDHPRRCGENDGVPANFDDEAGSPPQVRGKQSRHQTSRPLSRITPAGAGKTRRLRRAYTR